MLDQIWDVELPVSSQALELFLKVDYPHFISQIYVASKNLSLWFVKLTREY
jgi:hypothetical protein